MKNIGIHHYLSKYRDENNDLVINSWIQIDFLKWCWCFSEKEMKIKAGTEQTDKVQTLTKAKKITVDIPGMGINEVAFIIDGMAETSVDEFKKMLKASKGE